MNQDKTETDKKPDAALAAEAKRAESQKNNLQDEQTIKVLNANFTVKASTIPDGDQEKEQAHLGELVTALVDMIAGIENHFTTDFVIAKEKMRGIFNDTALIFDEDGKITNSREVLTVVADTGLAEVKAIFHDLKWTEAQLGFMYQLIQDQLPLSFVQKAKKTPKKLLRAPIAIPGKILEVAGIKKGKTQL